MCETVEIDYPPKWNAAKVSHYTADAHAHVCWQLINLVIFTTFVNHQIKTVPESPTIWLGIKGSAVLHDSIGQALAWHPLGL